MPKNSNKRSAATQSPVERPLRSLSIHGMDETVVYQCDTEERIQATQGTASGGSHCLSNDDIIFGAIERFFSGAKAQSLFSHLMKTAVVEVLAPFRDELGTLRTENIKFTTEVNRVNAVLERIKIDLDAINQNAKLPNIVLTTRWPDSNNATEAVEQITYFAKDVLTLSLDSLGMASCFRMGRPPSSSGSSQHVATPASSGLHRRPILVKFNTIDHKLKFIEAARKARSGKLVSPVFLNDDLTPHRRDVFKLARELKQSKKLADTWILNGRIYIKFQDETRISVLTKSALLASLLDHPVG